jgi:hypothetical protein
MAVDQSRLQAFARVIDARIVRAAIGGAHYWGHWAGSPRATRERSKLVHTAGRPPFARGAK